MELICEWNSFMRSLFTRTWLSSTYLNHHLGGLRADERVAKNLAANSYPANFIHNGRQLNGQQEIDKTD